MLIIEIPKNNDTLINEVQEAFDNCEVVEVDSLGTDTIVQILIPTISIGIPALSSIIKQIIKSEQTTIKYKNFELTGTHKNIMKILEKIKEQDSVERK